MREPASSEMRYRTANPEGGGPPSGSAGPPSADPLRKPQPPAPPPRSVRVKVEGVTEADLRKPPPRDPYKTRWRDLTPEQMASFRLYPKDED